jgi:hypothetical protein
LGDGTSVDSTITAHENDRFVIDKCQALYGGRSGKERRAPGPTGDVLQVAIGVRRDGVRADPECLYARLGAIGVRGNKHIPSVYLTGSTQQRRDLLAGLLDTDGSVGEGGKVEFSVVSKRLAEDALELIRSLGMKASFTEGRAKLYGRDVGPRYRVNFTPNVPVFTLPRKLAGQKLQDSTYGRAGYRCITAIEPVESVPVRCIQVDSPDSSYLMGKSYTVTHNTWSVSIGYVAWRIGKNPKLRVIVLSKVEDLAFKIVSGILKVVSSPAFAKVFPDFEVLSANAHIIKARGYDGVNPTVQAFSYTGSLMGTRVDLLVIDDPLDAKNTRTEEMRVAMYEWYQNTLVGRLTRDAQVVMVANAWHPRDMLHRLMADPGWYTEKFPIWKRNPHTGEMESCWPEQWPIERIKDRKRMLASREVYFRRQYECIAIDDASTAFKQEWIDKALEMGRTRRFAFTIRETDTDERFERIVIGVDLATKRPASRRKTDNSSFTVVGGKRYETGAPKKGPLIYRLLWIESGAYHGPMIVKKLEDLYRRFGGVVWVEVNAAQIYLSEFLKQSDMSIPVMDFETTGSNKHDPDFGVEAIGTEMSNGYWEFPRLPQKGQEDLPPAFSRLTEGMLSYSTGSHTSDELMSMFIAREGIRLGNMGVRKTTTEIGRR